MNMMILEHTGLLAIYINDNNATHFLSFSVEHVPKKIKKFISNKILRKDIYTIQKFDSIIFRYFYIEYICCMLNNKSLTNLTNLFWPNTREKQKSWLNVSVLAQESSRCGFEFCYSRKVPLILDYFP